MKRCRTTTSTAVRPSTKTWSGITRTAPPNRDLELRSSSRRIGPEPQEDDVAHEQRDPERREDEGHVPGVAAQAREHQPVEEQGDGGGEAPGERRRDHQRPAEREGADGSAERFRPSP